MMHPIFKQMKHRLDYRAKHSIAAAGFVVFLMLGSLVSFTVFFASSAAVPLPMVFCYVMLAAMAITLVFMLVDLIMNGELKYQEMIPWVLIGSMIAIPGVIFGLAAFVVLLPIDLLLLGFDFTKEVITFTLTNRGTEGESVEFHFEHDPEHLLEVREVNREIKECHRKKHEPDSTTHSYLDSVFTWIVDAVKYSASTSRPAPRRW